MHSRIIQQHDDAKHFFFTKTFVTDEGEPLNHCINQPLQLRKLANINHCN